MPASRVSETDLSGLGEEHSESEPLTRQVVQMSASTAHHGTRHTRSLRLACATAFVHPTERTSSGQISILSKRALPNLLPSRGTNNPKRTLRGALLSSLWRAGEDTVHLGCLRCVSIEPCPACWLLCLRSRHCVSRV